MTEKYDLIVIGGGPAGEKGASKAAYYGKRVALVERAPYLGGAGINTGTVPSKTLREPALYFSGLQQRGLYGIDYSFKENLSIKDFMFRERTVVDNERKIIEKTVRRHNISVMHGEGSLKDAHTVHVKSPNSEMDISGEIILIATGSSPVHPPDIPFDGKLIYDSEFHSAYGSHSQNHGGRGRRRDRHGIRLHLYSTWHTGNIDRAARTHRFLSWIQRSPNA